MRHAEFVDPRLVEVYDAECPWSREDDFFLAIVGETPARRVLDLGCGTGRLALGMARAGHLVTGVDPARASLEAARTKHGAEAVTWLEGTSSMVPDLAFDVAVRRRRGAVQRGHAALPDRGRSTQLVARRRLQHRPHLRRLEARTRRQRRRRTVGHRSHLTPPGPHPSTFCGSLHSRCPCHGPDHGGSWSRRDRDGCSGSDSV